MNNYTNKNKTILGCIQKFPDWVDNEINNNKNTLSSNKKVSGGKTHYTDSADSYTICSSRSRRPVRKLLDTPSYASM
jgi:D-alanyl-D-alanine carboxypeptidase